MIRPLIALSVSILLAGAAHAEPEDEENTERKRRGPPEVAFEACASSVEGDPCAFEGRRGETVDGTCKTKQERPLVCVPEGGPPDRRLQRS
ncbi:MAG: hypothetical protein AAGA33_14860 [Pseudomonadota bacterium]